MDYDLIMAWIISAVGVVLFFAYFALQSSSIRSSVVPDSFQYIVVVILSLVGFSLLALLSRNIYSFLASPVATTDDLSTQEEPDEISEAEREDLEARAREQNREGHRHRFSHDLY